jgi:putative peptidoglycan lipid II flippase
LNLLRSAATVSGLTLLSRITGLIRENLTATVFGASALTDAFFVAFRLPNLLRRMFAEGAFSQAFVPILAAAREGRDEGQMHRLLDRVATVLFWALVAVSALAWCWRRPSLAPVSGSWPRLGRVSLALGQWLPLVPALAWSWQAGWCSRLGARRTCLAPGRDGGCRGRQPWNLRSCRERRPDELE